MDSRKKVHPKLLKRLLLHSVLTVTMARGAPRREKKREKEKIEQPPPPVLRTQMVFVKEHLIYIILPGRRGAAQSVKV